LIVFHFLNQFALLSSNTKGSGQLEFDEFLTLTARFLVEEDAEAMQEELREAFRLYDKEGTFLNQINRTSRIWKEKLMD
jgi:Ca2+-binding EF-hand superfamily protein